MVVALIPGSFVAPAITEAFRRAAVGFAIFRTLRRYSRIRATAPAAKGVAMLVPPIWKYCLLAGKAAQAVLFAAIIEDRVESINVPGATTSGLSLLSRVGPRLLKAAT